jgi:hypothetical protein
MHDISLFIKAIILITYSMIAIILQSADMIMNNIPAGIIKITWGGMVMFMGWFVVSVYQDFKAFKKEVYPSISKINERLAVVENELEIKK